MCGLSVVGDVLEHRPGPIPTIVQITHRLANLVQQGIDSDAGQPERLRQTDVDIQNRLGVGQYRRVLVCAVHRDGVPGTSHGTDHCFVKCSDDGPLESRSFVHPPGNARDREFFQVDGIRQHIIRPGGHLAHDRADGHEKGQHVLIGHRFLPYLSQGRDGVGPCIPVGDQRLEPVRVSILEAGYHLLVITVCPKRKPGPRSRVSLEQVWDFLLVVELHRPVDP